MISFERLKGEIALELDNCTILRQTIIDTLEISNVRPLTTLELAGASSLLMQLYNSVENMFKRIMRYYRLPLPVGDDSHFQLLLLFSTNHEILPLLVPDHLRMRMSQLRKVRHVIIHGYTHTLEPIRIFAALLECPSIVEEFSRNVHKFLESGG